VITEVQPVPTGGWFKRAGVKETAVLMAAAWLVPFAIHLLPWSGDRPLGAHLLPMFWASFVAVYLYGARIGLLVGLFSPIVNLVVTGMPALRWLSVLGFELVIFVLFAWWTVRRTPKIWLIAPMAYVVAKVCSTFVHLLLAPFGSLGEPGSFFIGSLRTGLLGLAALAAVNYALILLYPKPDGRGSHDAPRV